MSVERPEPIHVGDVDLHVAVIDAELLATHETGDADVAIHALEREVGVVGHFDAEIHRKLRLASEGPPQTPPRINRAQAHFLVLPREVDPDEVEKVLGLALGASPDRLFCFHFNARLVPPFDAHVAHARVDDQHAVGKKPRRMPGSVRELIGADAGGRKKQQAEKG